jgi:hypothetical protein
VLFSYHFRENIIADTRFFQAVVGRETEADDVFVDVAAGCDEISGPRVLRFRVQDSTLSVSGFGFRVQSRQSRV